MGHENFVFDSMKEEVRERQARHQYVRGRMLAAVEGMRTRLMALSGAALGLSFLVIQIPEARALEGFGVVWLMLSFVLVLGFASYAYEALVMWGLSTRTEAEIDQPFPEGVPPSIPFLKWLDFAHVSLVFLMAGFSITGISLLIRIGTKLTA